MQTPVSGFILVLAFRLAPFARLRLQIILVIASDPLRARNSVGPTKWRSSQEWSPTAFPSPRTVEPPSPPLPRHSSTAVFATPRPIIANSDPRPRRSSFACKRSRGVQAATPGRLNPASLPTTSCGLCLAPLRTPGRAASSGLWSAEHGSINHFVPRLGFFRL